MMTYVLTAGCAAASIVIVVLAMHLLATTAALREAHQANRMENVALIASYVGRTYAAQVLRDAAADWDNPALLGRRTRIANTQYTAGGPSVPTLWLLDRANHMDPEVDSGD